MKEFLSQLGSLSWWLSVVIVGILINIASTLLIKKFDKYLPRFSTWRRSHSQKRQADRLRQLDDLKMPHEQLMLGIDIILRRLRGIQFLLYAIVSIIIVIEWAKDDVQTFSLRSLIVRLVGLILFAILLHVAIVSFMRDTFNAINGEALLREARKSENDS